MDNIKEEKPFKKRIVISIPCRNEEDNIIELVDAIELQFQKHLLNYDYTIQFSDNCSTDSTRTILRKLCNVNSHVRAIFNVSNVSGSAIHSLLQADGDCCIHMCADFQDPPNLIRELVYQWEKGSAVVCAIKTASEESKRMWWLRSLYYKIMCGFSTIKQIEHFTGFGLYDHNFLEIIRSVEDSQPTLRGYVAEYGYNVSEVHFKQPQRKHGKSGKNFMRNFDYAMNSFTTYTRIGIHLITLLGGASACLFALLGAILLFLKFVSTSIFISNSVFLAILMLFIGSVQTAIIGVVGEYILNINRRMLKRPLAIELERVGNWTNCPAKADTSEPYCSIEPIKNKA